MCECILYMYVYVCVCVCVCVREREKEREREREGGRVFAGERECVCLCVYNKIYMHMHEYIWRERFVYKYVHTEMNTCINVLMSLYTCIYMTHTHTHTHTLHVLSLNIHILYLHMWRCMLHEFLYVYLHRQAVVTRSQRTHAHSTHTSQCTHAHTTYINFTHISCISINTMHTRTRDIYKLHKYMFIHVYTLFFDANAYTHRLHICRTHIYTPTHHIFVCTITCFCIRICVCISAQAFAANALLACANTYACTYIMNIYIYKYTCVATMTYKYNCIFAQVWGGYGQ